MKNRRDQLLRVCLTTLCVTTSAALAVDTGETASWPTFHGSGRTNISSETGLLKSWPEGGPRLIWRFSDCGRGFSGVTIADGMIFTAGDFDNVEMIIALDMDGHPLWKVQNSESWRGASPGSRATPTYNDGKLYHLNPTGRLVALEAKTGKTVWSVDLKEKFDAQWGHWGLAENVIVEDGKVFCMPGGSKGRVVALDQQTGETVWANTEINDTAAYCSPAIVTHGGIRQLITMAQKTVLGIDIKDGRLLWTFPFVPRSPQNALTPVYHDGYVFVACGHSSGGTVFQISPDSKTTKAIWYRKDLDNCHGGAILVDGKLFGCGCRQGGKQFYCVDFLTGETVKMDKSLSKVGISCADGKIYCLNHQGTMSLLDITPQGFDINSQFSLGRRPANTCLAHPVICGGRLYLRHEQNLSVYDIREK